MESTDSSEQSSTSNVMQVKDTLADLTAEAVYDYFSQKAGNMREIVESFEVMKEKLGLAKKSGIDVYRGLKMTLGAQGTKAWKARDVLNLLDKRANQKEYMQQVSEGEKWACLMICCEQGSTKIRLPGV